VRSVQAMSVKDELKRGNLEIRKSIIIEAPPEVIFKAISDPKELTQWFPDEAIIEPKVGALVRFVTIKEIHPEWKLDKDYIVEGTVKEFVPNKRLSYTWKYNDIPDFPETTVIWELEQIDSSKTIVNLTHLGFTGKETGMTSHESHDQGWTEVLNNLSRYSLE
jgi:uncharacterized protein YndB with AHSA1/START domain